MSCPATYPTVLNGQVYYNDSSTVEFECLSGFYMTGNKRITCSGGVWETAPTCSVIRQYDEVTVFRESRPSSYLPLDRAVERPEFHGCGAKHVATVV